LAVFVLALLFLAASPAPAQKETAKSPSFFSEKLYPVLENAGCRACHATDGVASTTRIHFPPQEAGREQVEAFGIRLAELTDRNNAKESLLFLKPTARISHTGGERIAPGSEEDAILSAWVDYLTHVSAAEVAAASAKLRVGSGRRQAGPMRRLTHSQYDRTIRDLLGITSKPSRRFPPEDYVHGFKNQAEAQSISPTLTESYSGSAEKLATTTFGRGDATRLLPCRPASASDSACAGKFIQDFGLKAFRRPLAEEELAHFRELFQTEARRCGEFLCAAQIVVETMLQSPGFLFHVQAGPDERWKQYEIANRLSYFLWDSMPDEELFRSAKQGKLSTPDGIEKEARRMLADPKAGEALQEFVTQWLYLDRLTNLVRDRRRYRQFTPELAAAMVEETRHLIDDLVWNDRNFMEFLTAQYTFINSDLADMYGLPAPAREFGMVDYPADSPRAGLLGHASFLTLTSQPAESSPTVRGLFIREQLLCQKVPPPPPGVNTNLPPQTESSLQGTRQRLEAHVSNPACAGCHTLTDGIGFGFEHFDAIGRWRAKQQVTYFRTGDDEREGRNPINAELEIESKAHVAGIPDSTFSSPKDLAEILGSTDECQICVVRQLFRYAFARSETPADEPLIQNAWTHFRESGFKFKALMMFLVLSDEFREGA
jgi:hypothetical protein